MFNLSFGSEDYLGVMAVGVETEAEHNVIHHPERGHIGRRCTIHAAGWRNNKQLYSEFTVCYFSRIYNYYYLI